MINAIIFLNDDSDSYEGSKSDLSYHSLSHPYRVFKQSAWFSEQSWTHNQPEPLLPPVCLCPETSLPR